MTGTEYNRAIVQHLGDSEKLIVVCSPGARASEYVDDEIRRFVEVNEAGNIIPVLLEGIPNNAAEGGPEELMDFPAALCEAIGYFFQKSTKSESLITEKLVACYAKSVYLNGKRKHHLVIPANAGIQKINSAYRFLPARE